MYLNEQLKNPPNKQDIWFLLTQKPTTKKNQKNCFLPTLEKLILQILLLTSLQIILLNFLRDGLRIHRG